MTGCFRCGATEELERFGNSFICRECTPDSRGTRPANEASETPGPQFDTSGDHENPIDISDVTDAERAVMLREYLERFVDEFGGVPRLMPLDSEGKAPIIQGRARLDSPEGREFLVDGEEAIRQIREEGARGFAIYAGKRDHGTEDVVFVDHDDVDAFPTPTTEPTLEVLSGSGRGPHETYRNAGDVRNARVGDNVGEIRAGNWYVVAPGSVHPTGGVYHMVEDRDIATLADGDLDDSMRPAAGRRDRGDGPTAGDLEDQGEEPDDDTIRARLEKAFANDHDGDRIQQVYDGRYRAAGFDDRSAAEFWLANRLDSWVGRGNRQVVERLMDRANLQKWPDRPDRSYRGSVLSEVGNQDWYYDPTTGGGNINDVERTPVLPVDDSLMTPVTGWDWRHAAVRAKHDTDPVQEARDRTTEKIVDALENHDRVIVEALPTLGKSYGGVQAVALTGRPSTFLVGRGNVEQYDQIREWCDEFGLSYYTLPSFTRDCDTANGEFGEDWAETVRDWYHRGATPQEIHKYAEKELGDPLPCQQHQGHDCPYASKWDFDPEDYDVLIGHYTHAYKQSEKVTIGRAVIFDEFPGDTYERSLGEPALKGAVTHYLQNTDEISFDDYTELLEHRDDDQRRADALAYLTDTSLEPDGRAVFQDRAAHATAPLATFTILAAAGDDLKNGLERAPFPDDDNRVGVFDRAGVFSYEDDSSGVRILDPPSLDYTTAVVALDGTPTVDMWELSLGERLNKRRVLSRPERQEYVANELNLNVVRTTEFIKPYNSADHVDVDGDAALLEAVHDQHSEKPGLITTTTALDAYQKAGMLSYDPDTGDVDDGVVERVRWRGNVLGSNEFKEKRLGVVIGSNHFGDGFIKKWGAYADVAVTREAVDADLPAKGENLTYGSFGDKIHQHMTEHDTLQAVMRFGRDGNGALVYCHTDTLPEWVPIAAEGRIIKTRSDGERQVLSAAEGLDEWRTGEVADHPDVEISERQVFNILNNFAERGVLRREWDGRGYTWTDNGLEELNDHGDVDLGGAAEVGNLDELGDKQVAEMARNSIYTWDFRNSETEGAIDRIVQDRERLDAEFDPGGDPTTTVDGGDPPD